MTYRTRQRLGTWLGALGLFVLFAVLPTALADAGDTAPPYDGYDCNTYSHHSGWVPGHYDSAFFFENGFFDDEWVGPIAVPDEGLNFPPPEGRRDWDKVKKCYNPTPPTTTTTTIPPTTTTTTTTTTVPPTTTTTAPPTTTTTTSTTEPPTTTTTVPPTTTTSTTTTTTVPPSTTTTTVPPSTTTSTTTPPTTTTTSSTTTTTVVTTTTTTQPPVTTTTRPPELPRTGFPLWVYAIIGGGFTFLGWALVRVGDDRG